jgi:26S proteasome regulatory subunit N9
VRIISFLELLFEIEKDDRSLNFDRIVAHCKVDKNDIELLLMKAMSLQLNKGNIDEVYEVIHVDWMFPRYLSKSHIQIIARILQDWENNN